jgi:hypothetical protein
VPAVVVCFAGGGGGGLEVPPGGGQAAHVDGLPSGQGGSIGQDGGEMLTPAGVQGVAQADGDVGDVGFELGRDGWRSEPAVQQADGVGFLLEDLDDRGVDVAGAGDLAQQLALLLPALGGRRLVAGRAADGSVATPSRMRPCSGMFRPSAILV